MLGRLVVDEVVRLAGPLTPGTQQRALGRQVRGGGQVWHTGLGLLSEGVLAVLVGTAGDEADADRLLEHLSAIGAECHFSRVSGARRSLVFQVPGQERTIVSLPRGRPTPGPDPARIDGVDWRSLGRVDWVHLDGFSLPESDQVANWPLGPLARLAADGVPASLGPPSLRGIAARAAGLAALPPLAALLGRTEEVDAVLPLLATSPDLVVRHDGARPVRLARTGRDELVVPVPAAEVDTLGAGDRFTAGVLAVLAATRGHVDDRAAVLAGIRAGQRPAVAPPPDGGAG